MKKVFNSVLFVVLLCSAAYADTFTNVNVTNGLTVGGGANVGNNLTAYNLISNNNITAVNNITASNNVTATNTLTANIANVGNGSPTSKLFVNGPITGSKTLYTTSWISSGASLSAATYLSVQGVSYLGSYAGGYALTVSTDGSVVMKKAQGDISMGIYGN